MAQKVLKKVLKCDYVPVKSNTIPTIRHWFEVFRSKLPDDQETLDSLIQIDEVDFGSKSKNTIRVLFMGK